MDNNFRNYLLAGICFLILVYTLTTAELTKVVAQACAPVPSGIVSWWPFENGTATDLVDGNNGSLVSGTSIAGKVAGALSDPRVDVPDNTNLRMNNPFTIEAWVLTSPTGIPQMIIVKGGQQFLVGGSCPCNYDLEITPTGKALFEVRAATVTAGELLDAAVVFSTTQVADGSFHHVAGVFDGTTASLFVDGVLEGQDASKAFAFQTDGVATSPDPVNLGYYNHIFNGPSAFFMGTIDEIAIYNRALGAAEIQAIFNAGSAGKCKPCTTPPTGMVNWWPGDGNANDIQGGNNGTLQNGATFGAGKVGQAFSLDGVNDYVDVGDVDLPTTFTIDAWIHPASVTDFQTILSKDDGIARSYFFQLEGVLGPSFNLPGGTLVGSVQNPGGGFTQYRTTTAVVTAGTWQHVAMTYDGAAGPGLKMSFYVNGVSYPTTVISPAGGPAYDFGGEPNNTSLSAKIGIFGDAINSPFNGLIDEVEVFNRVLSLSEIQSIFNAGSAGKCKPSTNSPPVAICNNVKVGAGPGCTANASIDNGSFDPDPGDTITVSQSPAGPYPLGTTTVTLTVTDSHGASSSCFATVTVVDNTPPSITCPANITMVDNVPGSCGASVDPGTPATSDNCGIKSVVGVRSDSKALTDLYSVGTTTIAWVVTDTSGNMASCTQTVTVTNPAPVVSITGPASGSLYAVNTPVNFTGSFADNAGDTHSAVWTFDGTPQAGVVNEATRTVSASHTFDTAGVYLVTLTVTDDCGQTGTANQVGGFDALVVIYDLDAGFVTGGGWINSPAGAYAPNPSLVGKANFGFVSKYQKGANVPDGQTEFQFKVANLNFHSTIYEWLVVAGARAQYKGSGTINGAGNYGFMLTAIDGDITGGGGIDKFRIKIWDKNNGDAVVYDNQMGAGIDDNPTTALAGGSIVIHK